jgi:hypothetical protein
VTRRRENQWRPRAATAALTRLTHEFWDRYRELIEEERAAGTAKRPQTRARTRLSHEQPRRYQQLYHEECERMLSLPEKERFSDRPRYVQIRPERSTSARKGAA